MKRTATALLVLLAASRAGAFEINGRHWPERPIPYYVNPGDCAPMEDGTTFAEIVEQAVAEWSSVACADVAFEEQGTTTATAEADGQNTFYCVAENWGWSEGTAGANRWVITAPPDDPEADIAINGDTLQWVAGGPDGTQTGMIDPVGVMTHELGHFLGLAHSPDPFATMYFGHLPNGIQATVSADDKAGVCSIYPNGVTECETDEDCGEGRVCTVIQDIPVCQDLHAQPGDFCSKTFLDCDGMCWVSFYECWQLCLFTDLDYTEGYCSPLCNDTECPAGFTCTYLAQYDVNICFLDEPDGGPDGGEDGGFDGGMDGGDDGIDAGADATDAYDAGADTGPADDGGSRTDGADKGTGDVAAGGGCGCQTRARMGGLFLITVLFLIARRRTG